MKGEDYNANNIKVLNALEVNFFPVIFELQERK